jgi:hypothetical protein
MPSQNTPGGSKQMPFGTLVWRGPQAFRHLGIFLLLFATTVLLQWRAGCAAAEFSGYPDEAAHYLSGLLVKDYVAAGFPAGPMRFAQDFYRRYPYIAIGHWPPLFYAVEGFWMLAFSPSRLSVMLLMALITTLLAYSTYVLVRREFGGFAALAVAWFLVFLPIVQRYTGMVMLDTLLALLSLWAILCFAHFLDGGRWQDALKFGILSSLAILTKGNGFYLALVPPITLLLSRRFSLLKKTAFWLPVAIVLVPCVPWHLFTMHLMLPTFVYTFGVHFTVGALRFYSAVFWNALGPIILGLTTVGLASLVWKPRNGTGSAIWMVAPATLCSLALFYCLVPAGTEARYIVSAIPMLLLFFVAGADYLSRLLPVHSPANARNGLILLSLAIFALTSFEIPRKQSFGFREAANRLASEPGFKNSVSLVSSDSNMAEGLLVAEAAMHGRHDNQVILRASKVLADNDWNDTYYRLRYTNSQVLKECLEKSVQFLILDVSPRQHFEHHQQLLQIVSSQPERWQLIGEFTGDSPTPRAVRIYRPVLQNNGTSLAHVTRPSVNTDHWPISLDLNCGNDPATATAQAVH